MRFQGNPHHSKYRSYRLRSEYPVRTLWPHRFRSSRGRHVLQFVAALGLLTLPIAVIAEASTNGSNDDSGNKADATTPASMSQVSPEHSDASQNMSVSTDQTGSEGSVSHSVTVHSAASSDGDGSSAVNINGKHYNVPAGGDLHKTVNSGDSHTTVDVSSDDSTSSSSSSTLNVEINSSTETSTEGGL